MAVLSQLKHVDRYLPCDWDLKTDAAGRRYWVNIFLAHVDVLLGAARETYPEASDASLREFRERYLNALQTIIDAPESFDEITIFTPIQIRLRLQIEFGFLDPFKKLKDRENESALRLAPAILEELRGRSESGRAELLASNLLAGNMFDAGASAAYEHYQAQQADFERLRDSQPSRPWLVDTFDAWRERWLSGEGFDHAAFFVDNSGSDIILGCLPLACWMAEQGARVTLLANTQPALNDVTAPELNDLLDRYAVIDEVARRLLGEERIRAAASGGDTALLDLRQLDTCAAQAIEDADLVILQGMGRAIETNYYAEFDCSSLRTAVLKDEQIAKRLGGDLFDCVFRFVA